MTQKFKRALACAAAAALALAALTGCGGDSGAQDTDSSSAAASGVVYVPEFTQLGGKFSYVDYVAAAGNSVYFTADVVVGEESYTDDLTGEVYTYDATESRVFRINMVDSSVTQLPWTPPEDDSTADTEVYNYVGALCTAPDGSPALLLRTYCSYYDLPEDFDETVDNKWEYWSDSSSSYTVVFLDADGYEASSFALDFPDADSDDFWVNYFALDAEGRCYIGGDSVYVFAPDGSLLSTAQADTWIDGFAKMADGSVRCVVYNGGYDLQPIDPLTGELGEGFSLPSSTNTYFSGDANYDIYYATGVSLYGFDTETGESTLILGWLDAGVEDSTNAVILPDGRVVSLMVDWSDDGSRVEMVVLTPTDASLVQPKTELTLACDYMSYYARSEIARFNRTSATAKIVVTDYSVYNDYSSDETASAGIDKLNTEIISGNVPDILLCSYELPLNTYAAKGILTDLWPFIDADTELGGREAFVESFFDALADGDSLYRVASGFYLNTVCAPSQLVGDEMGWTVDDVKAALAQLEPDANVFGMYYGRDDLLYNALCVNLGNLIDWSTGECRFDSEEFIDILQFAALEDEFDSDSFDWETDYESDYSRILNGRQLCYNTTISDFGDIEFYKALFGGQMTFKGYPSLSGNGSAFNTDFTLSISEKCANKDLAWEFVRVFLTEDYQTENVWAFPSNVAAFEAKAEEAMTPEYYTDPETGEQVEQSKGGWGMEDLQVEIYALSQDEYDQLSALIGSTSTMYEIDNDIMTIITDACSAFFNGQDTAENAAKQVQSRMSIYVSEQS
ncbi:MAG: extracellular solute-binding protein [Oscillospiraceae bacterium]|nr:extracellular solute-binding protein [Oscillospiraceae bacterium]